MISGPTRGWVEWSDSWPEAVRQQLGAGQSAGEACQGLHTQNPRIPGAIFPQARGTGWFKTLLVYPRAAREWVWKGEAVLWVAKGKRRLGTGLDSECGRGKEKPCLLPFVLALQRLEALETKDEVFGQMVPGCFSAQLPGN